jgi:dihydrolipoamide dehydrogenase
MDKEHFDVVVIGGGPGGYPAAIRAAHSGKSVALIEANQLGGTCLNRGCIPSKALIACADVYDRIKDAAEFGITVEKVSFDYGRMVQRKDEVVAKLRKSLEGLIATNKIKVFKGFGQFSAPKEIKINGENNLTISADKIIIATGSEPRSIPAFPFDYEKIHDSTSLLNLKKLPQKIVIVGGGVIGCEFASLFAAFGVSVVILEMLPRILPMESKSVSDALIKAFKKAGIAMETGVKVEGIDKTSKGISARVEGGKVFDADIALVAVGRQMNTSAIGLDKAGVIISDNGMIPVSDKMETNVPGIYAVGDIASKWWLAHVATHQGWVAASNAVGDEAHMRYEAVPNVIFTHPEIGTVGLSLEDALEKGYQAVAGAFPFQALGKSQATHQTEGFAQVIIDQRSGQVLGAQVIGHEASALVAEMAVAVANELTLESITETIHAHPTIAEAWLEAALVAAETPMHFPPKPKKNKN